METESNHQKMRWCAPYAESIIHHHLGTEQCLDSIQRNKSFSQEIRNAHVEGMMQVVRHVHMQADTLWEAVTLLDRYGQYSALSAVACIQLANVYQETAPCIELKTIVDFFVQYSSVSPVFFIFSKISGSTMEILQAMIRKECWTIIQHPSISCNLYWPHPRFFYRHFSLVMNCNAEKHCMVKLIVDATLFAPNTILWKYRPSRIAASALVIADFVTSCNTRSHQPYSKAWMRTLIRNGHCIFVEKDCLSDMFHYTVKMFPVMQEAQSLMRRFSKPELFETSTKLLHFIHNHLQKPVDFVNEWWTLYIQCLPEV